jgi:pyruvate,water dikinase
VPIMKLASAIVTDQGGRTCHAAIISRELGIPCIVGTGNGSNSVKTGQDVTVSCAGGSKGTVYDGKLPYKQVEMKLSEMEMPKIAVWFHQSNPDRAFPDSVYPAKGVGLLRMDEVIRDEVKVHPLAAIHYAEWKADGDHADAVKKIEEASLGYADKSEYFTRRLAEGIGCIAASVYPRPVRVLLPDATSRDLDRLIGGSAFSWGADEANPALGARGAARYTDLDYEEAVALELAALTRARKTMGMTNISIVFPAVQSDKELKAITNLLSQNGLKRGTDGMEYHLLCRTPAQLLGLDAYAAAFDGFVFEVSEISQLTQGMDGRNVRVRGYYQEDHPAVMDLLQIGIESAKKLKKPIGLANIAPAKLAAFAQNAAIRKADYLAIRPELFANAREAFLEAQGKK